MKMLILILTSILLLSATVEAQEIKAFYDDFELLEVNGDFTISYKIKQDKFYSNPEKTLTTSPVEKRFIIAFYVKNNRPYPIYIKEPIVLTMLIGAKGEKAEVKLPFDFIPMGMLKSHRTAVFSVQTPFAEGLKYKVSHK
ncbi:MAG: hypothetical protein GY810_23500 [Aureispira sp.]|nr:hypothetical protein [Aureispira sp.]